MTKLGIAFREARKALELTQIDVSEEAGINQAWYSGMETGKIMPADPDMLHRLGLVLGISKQKMRELTS